MEKYGKAVQATDDNTILPMMFACWIINVINAHLEYVILTAFPRQQCSLERVSMLCYTYVACLFIFVGRAVYIKNENLLETLEYHSTFSFHC